MNLRTVITLEFTYKDDSIDLLAERNIILNKYKIYFYQLLNVCLHKIDDIEETEIYTPESLTPELKLFFSD
jgi:hypothetical protein